MARGSKQVIDADHRRFVGENLALVRTALGKRSADWVKDYPTYITSAGKLTNWEVGDNYPALGFLLKLCEDYGLTTDWFYRGRLAGLSSDWVDDLRKAAQERSEASSEPAG
jgi:hypothetical protein